ncbi:hypothetical protein ES703_77850 [subsurface metagenome]
MLSSKSRRCYHRVISGLERGGTIRFLTLTSSKESPLDIQRSWRALYMRAKRRGLITGYIKVPEYTKQGRLHLHVLFRGKYIAQPVLSAWWQSIHHAKIVDIRAVKEIHGKGGLASEMAKYMAKAGSERYSWSWGWVWRGFCRDWHNLKRLWHYLNEAAASYPFSDLIRWWRLWLKGFWQPDFSLLPKPP